MHNESTPLPATKVCTKCGRELPREMFARNRSQKTGLRPRCRECTHVDYVARNKPYAQSWREPRPCRQCGKLFTPVRSTHRWCGEPCNPRGIPREGHHGTNKNYGRGCRCEACCQAHNDYANAYKEAHRTWYDRVCRNPSCGSTFRTPNPRQTSCCEVCQVESHRLNQIAERRRRLQDYVCPLCAVVFRTDGSAGANRVWCSRQCRTRARRLETKHGLTAAAYRALLERQDGRCPICHDPVGVFDSHVDHLHGSAHIRGILCRNCNIGLGHFQDDEQSLKRAIAYLRKNSQTRITLPG